MVSAQLDSTRRDALTQHMIEQLESRVPSVTLTETPRGFICVLSGSGWETRFRGPSRYDAVENAHNTFYWPAP